MIREANLISCVPIHIRNLNWRTPRNSTSIVMCFATLLTLTDNGVLDRAINPL